MVSAGAPRILVNAAAGRTGRGVIAALRARDGCPGIRALDSGPVAAAEGIEPMQGDMDDPIVRARAVAGVDTVIHYGPPMHPRETAMGTGMIDAAVAAGVRRFVFISVIHPEIDDLLNHKAKLAIESHLINSGLDWTVLRPQHYMQNIDVARAVAQGFLAQPYPVGTILGHVDMADLAEAAAKVAVEPGHAHATYDIASAEHLSVIDICAAIQRAAGKPIEPRQIAPDELVDMIRSHGALSRYAVEAYHRLFGYYARIGISGNANVLTWLLGRPPRTLADYIRRSLAPA